MTKHKQDKGGQRCCWTDDGEGNWDTDCGEKYTIIDGTPTANGMRFCCFCGLALKDRQPRHD